MNAAKLLLDLRTGVTVTILAILAPLLFACAPSPETMCSHILELTRAELGAELGALSDDDVSKLEARCVADASKDKSLDPKGYARRAECAMAANSLAALTECQRPKPAAKPAAE